MPFFGSRRTAATHTHPRQSRRRGLFHRKDKDRVAGGLSAYTLALPPTPRTCSFIFTYSAEASLVNPNTTRAGRRQAKRELRAMVSDTHDLSALGTRDSSNCFSRLTGPRERHAYLAHDADQAHARDTLDPAPRAHRTHAVLNLQHTTPDTHPQAYCTYTQPNYPGDVAISFAHVSVSRYYPCTL